MKNQTKSDLPSTQSVWVDTVKMPKYSPLHENVEADVCVVGAGIAGLTTAYLLCQSGRSVVVLDDGPIAGGVTEVTTAHLANAIDDRYYKIARLHGQDGARLAAESHSAAIDQIEEIVRREKIDCDFERLDGYLFVPPGEDEKILDAELAAAYNAGLGNVVKLPKAPISTFDTGACLRFPNQGQFNPLKYLDGIANAIQKKGGRIFAKTHADRIKGGSPATVRCGNHTVTARAIVVATNTPVNDVVVIHTKQSSYTTYAIGVQVPRGSVMKGLYWDTANPYHYVRLYRGKHGDESHNGAVDHDILIVGGEDHKTGQQDDAKERYERLEAWARKRFPFIGRVEFTWSGQVMETIDGLAFIGRNPMDEDNVYIVTGDSGMGMTHGTIAGILLTDLVNHRDNPWSALYDPSRKTTLALGTYISELFNVATQYTDWLTGGELRSEEDIAPDSGAVIRKGMTKVAIYRDEMGDMHECSAVCPHLGGIVHWNSGEKSWDCPCHGSRFDKFGKVINGPANKNLTKIESESLAASS